MDGYFTGGYRLYFGSRLPRRAGHGSAEFDENWLTLVVEMPQIPIRVRSNPLRKMGNHRPKRSRVSDP